MNTNAEFDKYFKMVVKRRYLFLFVAILVMTAIAVSSFFLPKKYQASSTVFIEKSVIKDLVQGITFTPSIEDKIRVLRYAMLSRVFLLKVMKDLDIDTKVKNEKELEQIVEEFQKKTDINIKGNDLFIVTYKSQDPKLATNYVNTLVQKYVEENISNKRQDSYGADRFLTEQLKMLKEKKDKSDEEIINFRQQRGVSIALDETGLVTDIKMAQSEIEMNQVKMTELQATLNALRRQLKAEEKYSVSLISGSSSSDSDAEVTMLENRVKQLLVNYTENYPEVIRLRGLIASLKKRNVAKPKEEISTGNAEFSTPNPIYQSLKQQVLTIESELEAVSARQAQLRSLVAQKSSKLRNIPPDQKKLGDLEKERAATQQIYDQLTIRQGQAELSKQMEVEDKATTYRIVDPAVFPKKPISPNRVRMIIMGILAGIAAGCGVVFLREMLDTSIKDLQSLKSLGYEILAVIPTMINDEEKQRIAKRDKLAYVVSGAFFAVVCLLLTHEVLELTFIERIITSLGIDRFPIS